MIFSGAENWSTAGRLILNIKMIGGPDRDRTDDLLHAMQALSQLSYGPPLERIWRMVQHSGMRETIQEILVRLVLNKENTCYLSVI